jgi:tRNA/rRNA methyltransferase
VNDHLQQCCIVLVRPQFPGNIGSVARAMANFQAGELRLVAPHADAAAQEARQLATRGEPILQQARSFPDLRSAVEDCVWTAATSARLGGLFRRQNVVTARQAAGIGHANARAGRIALVFGPEDHGLTTEEVSRCHHLITIPAAPSYNVLNLAQSVVICLYELFIAGLESQESLPTGRKSAAATASELDRTFDHLEEGLRAVHYVWGEKGPSVMHALRHLLSRAQPSVDEARLLHGLARQLLWYAQHHPARPGP